MYGFMSKLLQLFVVITLLAPASACKKRDEPAEPGPARVSATGAYEKYFGPAPTADKGTCFAFVIYFPSAAYPGKVVPFPFFTFDEGSIKRVAVERLLQGMDLGSYRGEFIPFAGGVRLLSIGEEHGKVELNFSKEIESANSQAFVSAIALTLRQFKGVDELSLKVDGRQTPLSGLLKKADESAAREPSPPRLLSLTAMRDKGAVNVEEVNAFFDRPVEVRELKLLSRDGELYAGDMYHAVFDMAAVLKPKSPELFKEGTQVRVRWKVADRLGREAAGDEVMLLEVRQHD